MRVYLPATLSVLAAALRAGEIGPAPVTGYAVTPALREWYASGDLEELEYAALTEAARASLRLLRDDPAADRRRVVIAVEVADRLVDGGGELADRAAVRVRVPVKVADIVSGHVDDPGAVGDVGAAADALGALDAGDLDAQFDVDGAEGHELMWYATQELRYLVAPDL